MTASNDFLDNLAADQHEKMLREIANDDLTPKKRDKKQETEIFENQTPPTPLYEWKMIDENGWWQRDPISDEECILICIKNAPCGTNKKQVDRLITKYQNIIDKLDDK